MPGFRKQLLGVAVGAAVAVALVFVVGPAADLDAAFSKTSHGGEATEVTFVPTGAMTPTRVEELHCFQCHDLKRYREGESFPHAQHAKEGVGHCHKCHAFEGHFRASIRKSTCEECH